MLPFNSGRGSRTRKRGCACGGCCACMGAAPVPTYSGCSWPRAPPPPPGGCSCAGTIFGGHRLSQPFTTFSLPFIVALPAGGRPQQQTSSWSTATVTSSVRRSPASTLISRRCVTALFLDLPLRHCRFHCLFLTSQCLDVALVFPLLRARTTDSSSVSMPCFPLMMAAAR